MILRICCQCQSLHPVRMAPLDFNVDDDLFLDITDQYVMDTHDAWGMACEGIGTQPQTIVSNNISFIGQFGE